MTPCYHHVSYVEQSLGIPAGRLNERTRAGVKALCPAHDDVNNSLHVTCRPEGKILMYCHAGCGLGAVLKAAHLGSEDLGPRTIASASLREKVYNGVLCHCLLQAE